MEANNSEITAPIETDSNGTPGDISAVEVEQSTDVKSVEGVDESAESNSETESQEELVYQLGDKEITLARLEELEKGNLLHSDYTKKSQVNAEIKKDLELKHQKMDSTISSLDSKVAELDALITKTDAEVDWDYLRDTDPSEFLKQKELLENKKKAAEKATTELQALKKAQFDDRVSKERDLLIAAHPDWDDKTIMEKEIKGIGDYIDSNGFTEADTNDLVNHLVYVAINKAAKYDALISKSADTEKAVQSAPNVVKASVKTATPKAQNTLASALYSTTN